MSNKWQRYINDEMGDIVLVKEYEVGDELSFLNITDCVYINYISVDGEYKLPNCCKDDKNIPYINDKELISANDVLMKYENGDTINTYSRVMLNHNYIKI